MRLLIGLLSICLFVSNTAEARPITLGDLCVGYTISKTDKDIYIRCPGDPLGTPWLTIKGCKNPVVYRNPNGNVTITCTFIV